MIRRLRLLLLVLVTAGLVASCATNGDGEALPQLPEPGVVHIHGLGLDESDDLYVATHFGLHVFSDGQWSRQSEDHADHMGFVLLSSDLMYRSGHPDLEMLDRHPDLGTNLGVQTSTDGGRRWTSVSEVLEPAVDFHAMTATSQQPPTLYGWDATGGRGTFRSSDGAESWERVQAEGLPAQVTALAVTADDSAVYASTLEGVYRSADHGATWQQISREVMTFLAADDRGDVLFASRATEVLRSTDEGQTWEPTELQAAQEIVAVACSEDCGAVLAADRTNTVYRSDDAGETWSTIPPP